VRRLELLLHVPALLTAQHVAAMRDALEHADAPWIDGRATAGYQGAAVKRNQQIAESSQTAREWGDVIIARLERNPLFISAALPLRVYPPMFNRYGDGMHFGSHVDGTVRSLPGTSQKLRTDLSATLFLSDPQSYAGGELVIESDFGDRTVKLAAGDMVVYTATSRHRVNPVTRGSRLASVFWIQSMIRDDVHRQQLFEVDQTVQRLTQAGADADSVLRLTAHYHTLLRLWSDL
jgi:PKHD-type hydroxylase